MENRSACKRDLMAAVTTFIQISSNSPIFFSTTFGTDKSIWPASVKKPFVTTIFILKFFMEDEPAHFSVIWSVLSFTHGDYDKKLGELSQ